MQRLRTGQVAGGGSRVDDRPSRKLLSFREGEGMTPPLGEMD
jgi:hypothetical protein